MRPCSIWVSRPKPFEVLKARESGRKRLDFHLVAHLREKDAEEEKYVRVFVFRIRRAFRECAIEFDIIRVK